MMNRRRPSLLVTAAAAAALAATSPGAEAFSVQAPISRSTARPQPQPFALRMADEGSAPQEEQQQQQQQNQPTEGSGEEGDSAPEEVTAEASEEDGEEPAEEEAELDPEIVALKEQIAELEATLKSKRKTLGYTKDQVEDFSKTGYARKVAEMENMRRVRSNLNTSSRSSAAANVLSAFLPAYDRLNEMKERYANDEFGSKLGGLSMKATFSDMGVKEYQVQVGDSLDDYRMSAVEETYSDEAPANTVVEVLGAGLELEGNVLRPAPCVVSKGAEASAGAEEQSEGEEEQEPIDVTSSD